MKKYYYDYEDNKVRTTTLEVTAKLVYGKTYTTKQSAINSAIRELKGLRKLREEQKQESVVEADKEIASISRRIKKLEK